MFKKLFKGNTEEKGYEVWVCDKYGGFASRIATFRKKADAIEYEEYKNNTNDDITLQYTVVEM